MKSSSLLSVLALCAAMVAAAPGPSKIAREESNVGDVAFIPTGGRVNYGPREIQEREKSNVGDVAFVPVGGRVNYGPREVSNVGDVAFVPTRSEGSVSYQPRDMEAREKNNVGDVAFIPPAPGRVNYGP